MDLQPTQEDNRLNNLGTAYQHNNMYDDMTPKERRELIEEWKSCLRKSEKLADEISKYEKLADELEDEGWEKTKIGKKYIDLLQEREDEGFGPEYYRDKLKELGH